MMRKKTQGRQKIEIKKIEDESNRQVTFSKRRNGIFRKASELCVLTGAEMAVMVQSPGGGRVFTFGHRSVDSVVDRYLARRSKPLDLEPTKPYPPNIDELNQEYNEIAKEVEAAKLRKAEVDDCGFWWENQNINELGLEDLVKYIAAMEELKENMKIRADDLKMIRTPSMSSDTKQNDQLVNVCMDLYKKVDDGPGKI